MKRIYKNTDLNFPISLLPVTENEELVVKFFTRSDKQFIQKTNDDIVDNHIMLAWSELETLDEGVLNIWTLVSSHDSNLDDNSYDVAEISNTPYYIVTNQKSEWDDDIANTILNNYYTKSEVDEKLSNLDVDVDLSQYALQSDLLELSGGVIDNEAVIAAALTELKETKLNKTEVPSLDGYATESWVTEQINNVDVSDELQNYYTKDEVDEAIKNADIDLTGYATEEWVDGRGFARKVLLTQAEYDALVEKDKNTIYIITDATDDGADVDLTNYYTKDEVDNKVANVKVDLTGYATESWVENKGYITGVDLSNYATESWVSEQLADIEVDVDLTGYATEEWVEDKDYINHVALTQAEYEAITPQENTMYIITDILDEWCGTQAEFDALPTKNPDTTYYITE